MHRVVARLDIKGPNLVKGIHLEGLRVLGKPEEFARQYYDDGADELMYQDVVASLFERNSLHEIISRTAKEIFIPLTVGGGIRTVDDIRKVLRAGADKVALNTAAIRNPELVREAAHIFGSSTIVVSIEAIKQPDGRYLAHTDNGREYTGIEVLSWAQQVEELGAGEILVTSVDRDGTGMGYDTELLDMVNKNVSIPVIAHGGAGSVQDMVQVLRGCYADAVCASSILHYGLLATKINRYGHEEEGNTEFLRSGKSFSTITPATIQEIKRDLKLAGIACRPVDRKDN